ncbi:T9SS type A sorting domain-containing protein, partial [Aureispira]|nr:T9SS type A sorting domain-containing protein [Aureispira sp.]
LQGGQGGSYGNYMSYSDSTCVIANSCFFFEIYDTYGDGIYAPNGYELYVDEILVSSGANDIQDYAIVTAHCTDSCNMTLNALNDLQGHINGITTLSNADLTLIKEIFNQFPECLADSQAIILLGKSVVQDYDNQIGALFATSNTVNGFSKDPVAAPGLEVERAMVALQQGIFDCVFTPEVYADYPQHIYNWKFNSCYNFPGYVVPPADSSVSNSIYIRADFADPDGMNPYFDINGDGTDHALRPTGLYLSPGSIATVTLPDSLVGQGYFIRVGSHEWDLGIRPVFKRLDRISKKFAIDSNIVEVFNPFGGAISILVPYGADDGIVQVSVNNGVECPFFSLKTFYETTDFNAELNKPGPWAVFETDNVMFTIPSHSIVPGQYNLMQAMMDWEAALRGVNSIMARQIIPDKHSMYMIADITIRHNVYSIGYPMSNTPLNFTSVPGPAYFMNGPGPDDEVNFHESGHALAMSKFPGEVEALVNFPYIMALNYGLGEDLNEAVKYSFVPNTFNIDTTAIHRMMSNSFGYERVIINSTTNEVRYQHRGYGHYFEIVNLFGWCPLRNFWKQESIDFDNGINHGINNQDIDNRILRMSKAAQVDLRPLLHFYGIIPQDSIALQDSMNQNNIPTSLLLYNRMLDYLNLIPQDNAAFINYAQFVYPNLYIDGPTANPDYGVGWHYQKSLTYNFTEAQQRTAILQSIIDLYYPNNGTGSADTSVCCILDTMHVALVNDEISVNGGVEPFTILTDTTGNICTVTVTDFNGCISTTEFITLNLSNKDIETIRIYPNPSSTEIYIDMTGSRSQIEHVQIVSISGQVLRQYAYTDNIIDVSTLKAGLYILQIELADGAQINKRILVL